MISDPSTSSGSLAVSAGAAIYARPAVIMGYSVTPAAADAVLTVYDNATAASGTIVAQMTVKASTSTQVAVLTTGIWCNNGLFYTLTGASATALVSFNPMR